MRLAALSLSCALVLAACSPGGGSDGNEGGGGDGAIKIVIAEYSAGVEPYFEDLVEQFEEQNPDYEADLQVINWNNIDQQVKTMVQTGQQPDILNINHFADFAADDLLRPAETVLSDEIQADLLPNFVEDATLDGTQYGIPFIASSRLFTYNVELFEQAGIDAPPETWNELLDAAREIQALGDGVVGYGLPLGPEEAQAESSLWFYSAGGDWTDGNGNWSVDSPQNVEAFEFLNTLVEAGVTQPNPATTNRTDLYNVFGEGKVGMLNGAVFLPSVLEAGDFDVDLGVAPIPGKDGPSEETLGVQDYLMAFDNEGNEEAVSAFFELFYQPENYVAFLEAEGFLPVTESASEELQSDPALEPYIEALPTANFYPGTIAEWPKVQGWVQQNIGSAVQGKDPAEVLSQAQEVAEQD
jgi:ABC-type glycerol-3-phosphate transport system substrate-binding protein